MWCVPVAIGIGRYGSALTDASRLSPNGEQEIPHDAGERCLMTSRISSATEALRYGAQRIGSGDQQAALTGDVPHIDIERVEYFALIDRTKEVNPKQPTTFHMFPNHVTNSKKIRIITIR